MPPRDRSDPGTGSGPSKYPGTFLLAFREALVGLDWQVQRWLGDQVACVNKGGLEFVVGLENLFRRVRTQGREDWPRLIQEFLSQVGDLDAGKHMPDTLDSVAENLLVRLGPPLQVGNSDERVWGRELTGTPLFMNLVVDFPNRMCYVQEKLVNNSGKPGQDWLDRALFNLRQRTPPGCFEVIDEDTGIHLCSVGDAYDSSRALVLGELFPENPPDGFFVTIPGRDQLLVLPVTWQALSFVHLMKVLAEKGFKSAPYPISDEIFWIRAGVWRLFPILIKGKEVSIMPPEEFSEVLARLSPPERDVEPPPSGIEPPVEP